jgi:hypothetical protein
MPPMIALLVGVRLLIGLSAGVVHLAAIGCEAAVVRWLRVATRLVQGWKAAANDRRRFEYENWLPLVGALRTFDRWETFATA